MFPDHNPIAVSNLGHAPSLSVPSQTAQKANIGRVFRGITHISSESGDDEEDEVSALEQRLDQAEDSAHMLKKKLEKADFRIKTVVEYAEHQRRIIALLNTQFIKWRHAKNKTEKRDVI